MNCSNCGRELLTDARFCHYCGTLVPTEARSSGNNSTAFLQECPICGKFNAPTETFRCKQCGRGFICLRHQDSASYLCSDCEMEHKAEPDSTPPFSSPARPPGAGLSVRLQGRSLLIHLADGVEVEMLPVPGGEFLMGSALSDTMMAETELPQHSINLREYWIGRFPVSVTQFAEFVRSANHKTTAEKAGSGRGFINGHWQEIRAASWQQPYGPGSDVLHKADHPVTLVSWDDALEFCFWLNMHLRAGGGRVEYQGKLVSSQVHLPSEAEWEKAARGVKGGLYPWGSQPPDMNCCNFNMYVGDTTPAGQYSPQGDSPYGCVDMAGNVWEWTSSLKKEYPYKAGDGREDLDSRLGRVLRGGSFADFDRDLRCAGREVYGPTLRYNYAGFRLAATLG